jgi:hypothetical protein
MQEFNDSIGFTRSLYLWSGSTVHLRD